MVSRGQRSSIPDGPFGAADRGPKRSETTIGLSGARFSSRATITIALAPICQDPARGPDRHPARRPGSPPSSPTGSPASSSRAQALPSSPPDLPPDSPQVPRRTRIADRAPRRDGRRGHARILPGSIRILMRRRLARPRDPVLFFASPRRRDARGHLRIPRRGQWSGPQTGPASRRPWPRLWLRRRPFSRPPRRRFQSSELQGHIDNMDAKHVWRAALGELQVSLSPANFETWLRDTNLIEVNDNLFRIAVPNGFAKDWLETRYRSLISQTLARIVGYSVQVEFVVRAVEPAPAAEAQQPRSQPAGPPRAGPGRRRGRRLEPQSALHLRQLHRRLGQPPRPRRQPVGGRATRPRLQPALPVRRGGPRQDPPDARHRQPGDCQVPAQEGRLRHVREVHQRVHHLDPAGQDRRVPGALPADRPAPDRRHPVHRRQGTDPGRVLPYVQHDPRGRQADRAELGPAAQADRHPRGAPAQPVRMGPHRRPDRA